MDYEDSNENFCERQGKAACCFCIGLLLVPMTMSMIFWNENDAVINYATANLVKDAIPVEHCLPGSQDNGKLVYAACPLKAPELAQDLPSQLKAWLPEFQGASIEWQTKIRQYVEQSHKHCEKDNHGGQHCRTTYSCSLQWVDDEVSSDAFRCRDFKSNSGHGFPSGFRKSGASDAPEYSVKLVGGAINSSSGLALDKNLQNQIPWHDLSFLFGAGPDGQKKQYPRLGGSLEASMLRKSNGYLSTSDGEGTLGDLRITIRGRSAEKASVAARQKTIPSGFALGAFPSQPFGWFGKRTKPLEKLEPGDMSQEEFEDAWRNEIAAQAWIIRIVTFILMIVAFEMIMQPLSVFADLLKVFDCCTCCLGSILDDIAQCIIHTVAFLMAVFLWIFTFALAWVVARPLLGICLLVIDLIVFGSCLYLRAANKKEARQFSAHQADPLVHAEMGAYNQPMVGAPSAYRPSGAYSPGGVPASTPVAVAAPVVQPQQIQMNVTCPEGVGPGGLVCLMAPNGQQVQVQVPANVYPGQNFIASVPA